MAKPRRKRIYMFRMYKLPDGQFFVYFGRWDAKTLLWGYAHDPVEDRLNFRIVLRNELEQGDLVPWKQQPWYSSDFSLDGKRQG